jgi:hypothetical protein
MVEDTSRHGAAAANTLLRMQQLHDLQVDVMNLSEQGTPRSIAQMERHRTEEELRRYHAHFGLRDNDNIFPSRRYGHSHHIINVPTGIQLLLVLAGEPQ